MLLTRALLFLLCCASSSVAARDPLLVVSTLDGRLTALDVDNGKELWSQHTSPLVHTSTQTNSTTPDSLVVPSVGGALFFSNSSHGPLQKLEGVRVQDLVAETPFVALDGVTYLGFKSSSLLSLDVSSGQLKSTMSAEEYAMSLQSAGDKEDSNTLWFTHTEYWLAAVRDGQQLWNVSLGEINALHAASSSSLQLQSRSRSATPLGMETDAGTGRDPLLLSAAKTRVASDVTNGLFFFSRDGDEDTDDSVTWTCALGSPVRLAYLVSGSSRLTVELLPSFIVPSRGRDQEQDSFFVAQTQAGQVFVVDRDDKLRSRRISVVREDKLAEEETEEVQAEEQEHEPKQRALDRPAYNLLGWHSDPPLMWSPELLQRLRDEHEHASRDTNTEKQEPVSNEENVDVVEKAMLDGADDEEHWLTHTRFRLDVTLLEVVAVVCGLCVAFAAVSWAMLVGCRAKPASLPTKPAPLPLKPLSHLSIEDGVSLSQLPLQPRPLSHGHSHHRRIGVDTACAPLGRGSHGTVVYRGHFEGREVAVKRLVKEFHGTLAGKEVELLMRSDRHVNVVRYYAMESDDTFIYLALERCKGSLYDVVENDQDPTATAARCRDVDFLLLDEESRPTDECLLLMQEMLSGVAFLHHLKIVHRDLKPHNILIGQDDRVKIADMGLSTQLDCQRSSFDSATAGTEGWTAPEVLCRRSRSSSSSSRGEADEAHRLTAAVDVFSLGCVLFYMLTGCHPFGSSARRQHNIRSNQSSLHLLDHLPPALHLVQRMLCRIPEQRVSCMECLDHPFFWDSQRSLNFLCEVSNRLEHEHKNAESRVTVSHHSRLILTALGGTWDGLLDQVLLQDLGNFRKYNFSCLRDFLRVLRNKRHHYHSLSSELQDTLGSLPHEYYGYFSDAVPELLLFFWKVAVCFFREEPAFECYLRHVSSATELATRREVRLRSRQWFPAESDELQK